MTTRLCDLADQFLRLAPWTWMHESQLIGIQHPDTNEIAWISIMGAAGNHRTLALYLDTPLHINPHIPALDVAANGLADFFGQI